MNLTFKYNICLQELEPPVQGLLRAVPLVVFEIKPQLLQSLPLDTLAECLLQAYYCLCKFNLTKSLFCLTDFKVWNYFEIEVPTPGNSPIINIVKSHVFLNNDIYPSSLELKSNLQYLVHMCLEDQ